MFIYIFMIKLYLIEILNYLFTVGNTLEVTNAVLDCRSKPPTVGSEAASNTTFKKTTQVSILFC